MSRLSGLLACGLWLVACGLWLVACGFCGFCGFWLLAFGLCLVAFEPVVFLPWTACLLKDGLKP
jgi:hypothetical protein